MTSRAGAGSAPQHLRDRQHHREDQRDHDDHDRPDAEAPARGPGAVVGVAEFVRLGSLHRNTFINAPQHLWPTLQWRGRANLFFAGQITGVEGYIESAATGLLAGINAAHLCRGLALAVPPASTALGSLLRYITDSARTRFQPMNVNFGLIPPLADRLRGKAKKEAMARRALADMNTWADTVGIVPADALDDNQPDLRRAGAS